MNKNKPLDHVRSTDVNAPNRTSKLVNKSEFNGSILTIVDKRFTKDCFLTE